MKSINLKLKKLGKTVAKSPLETALVVLVLVLLSFTAFPIVSAEAIDVIGMTQDETEMAVYKLQNAALPYGSLPESEKAEPRPAGTMSVTAYNSLPWQTDATPCIGAQGTDICEIYEAGENVCAANFVPLGTVLEVEGLGECVVRDRMNARYYYRVDWYMGMDLDGARALGVTQRSIAVYPSA